MERMRLRCLSQLAREPLWTERIKPPDLAKACEVRIERDERHAVFHGKRGKLGVGDEISADIQLIDQLSKDAGGPLGRLGDPAVWRRQPVLDKAPRLG